MDKRKTDRIKELTELLNNAARAYYQESREIMTNFAVSYTHLTLPTIA